MGCSRQKIVMHAVYSVGSSSPGSMWCSLLYTQHCSDAMFLMLDAAFDVSEVMSKLSSVVVVGWNTRKATNTPDSM